METERDPSGASMHYNTGRESLRDFHGWQEWRLPCLLLLLLAPVVNEASVSADTLLGIDAR
jgi:hypothetical protein